MERIFNSRSVIFGIIGGAAVNLFGAFDAILCALLVMIALDYITGIIKAVYSKTLSSAVGFRGIIKKAITLAMIFAANSLQHITGDNAAVRETVIMLCITNEGISLLENIAEFVPIPKRIKDVLLQLRIF